MSDTGLMTLTETVRAYAKPVFGFALSRTKQRGLAEDLAQDIMLQLVRTLHSGAVVQNMDAYVWSIARYTWVHWVKKRAHAPMSTDVNGMSELLADAEPLPLERMVESEAFRTLRREIAFLSETHRRVIVLHYYDGLKQSEVAEALGIPVGTVKWHLHDAKKQLKKGMERVREAGMLSVNPIRFASTGHAGSPGARGET